MIRKRFQRRPEFESLESMVLLGGLTSEHASVTALVAMKAKVDGPITLRGSAIGSSHVENGLGTPIKFSAVGLIKPRGSLKLKGSILLSIQNPTGELKISTAHGKLYAAVNESASGVFTYTITGGTGKWTHVSGSGEVFVFTVPSRSKGSSHGRIGIDFA